LKSDLLVLEATKKQLFTSTIIRPSNVFGVLMKNNSLFELIKTIEYGFYFFVGKKGASTNYVTVENVIETLYLGATNLNAVNKIYNISGWSSLEDFISIISKYLKKPIPKYRIPLGLIIFFARITSFIPKNPLTVSRLMALCNKSKYPIQKLENELNYKYRNSIDDGLKELVTVYLTRKLAQIKK
jgi:nucleoside-diphosphate-sugar epimerase